MESVGTHPMQDAVHEMQTESARDFLTLEEDSILEEQKQKNFGPCGPRHYHPT